MGTIASEIWEMGSGCTFNLEYSSTYADKTKTETFVIKAFGGTKTMIQKYFGQGKRILIEGRLDDASVVANMVTFVDAKGE